MIKSINTIGHQVSALAGSYAHARTKSAAKLRAGTMFVLAGGLFMVSTMGLAEAATDLGSYASEASGKTNAIVDIITYVCYIGGAILGALGVVDLKKHVENPGQTPMKNGLAKLGFGGILLAFPFITNVIQGTTGASGTGADFRGYSNKPSL